MKSSIFLPDDTQGTGIWRGIWPITLLWPMLTKDENISVTKTCPPDPNYFGVQNTAMIQRWTTPQQRALFDNALYPASQGGMMNIIYNIDDCMSADEIPTFNQAWLHYSKPEVQANIKHMLQYSDFVLVTTDTLKRYYINKYNVEPTNFIIMPNLLPRHWAFGLYDKIKKVNDFRQQTKTDRIRIGIISSASHYNVAGALHTKDTHQPVKLDAKTNTYTIINTDETVDADNVEQIPDDIDDIIDVIRQTADRFEWVSIGESQNDAFKQLIADKKITSVSQTNINQYMRLVASLELSAIVAPIKDSLFNRCKSDIKYLEAAAVGSLLFTPDLEPYKEHVPAEQRWTSNNDLIAKLYQLANTKPAVYGDMIQSQYDFLNAPVQITHGPAIANQWLDDNIGLWRNILFMPRKGMKIHLSSIVNEQVTKSKQTSPKQPNKRYHK